MTVLHVTDFQFNKRWFDWLLDLAPAHDLLVISGNLLDPTAPETHRRQVDWVRDWTRAYAAPLCISSGRRDLEWDASLGRWRPAYWLRELAGPSVWIDGQRVTLDGVSILNIGCTTKPKGGAADIWVVHTPPLGTLVARSLRGQDDGDPSLTGPIARHRPRIVLSGSVHAPVRWCDYRDDTLYLNPGRAASALVPNHILVGTDDMSSRFFTEQSSAAAPAESYFWAAGGPVADEPAEALPAA